MDKKGETHQIPTTPRAAPTTRTASELLELCTLPPSASVSERHRRISTFQSWLLSDPDSSSSSSSKLTLTLLLTSRENRDRKTGCLPLHWAAGTGFDEMIILLLDNNFGSSCNTEDENGIEDDNIHEITADQHAFYPSTQRTPLHYAARNGHLLTCRLLIERYRAHPSPKCARGSVTPLQLAVWQNRLPVVQYLVEKNNEGAVLERNDFECGLMHWVGLIPRTRWQGDGNITNIDSDSENIDREGSGVLPLVRYLHTMGVSYNSLPSNTNQQGHTPMHKATWGGNLALIRYFRDEHGVYDEVQDEAGNYCADIAKMRGDTQIYQWLLEHASVDRSKSYHVLGLEVGASKEEVQRRYWDLAKQCHPDKLHFGDGMDEVLLETRGGENRTTSTANTSSSSSTRRCDNFVEIKDAYEHLTKESGLGRQKNPKYNNVKLLENERRLGDDTAILVTGASSAAAPDPDGDLFLPRLLTILSDYPGEKGFPVSLIVRRWNQIWPNQPFPSPEEYLIQREKKCRQTGEKRVVTHKVKLLPFLKWKCRGTQVNFRHVCGDVLAFGNRPACCSTTESNQ